jgi:hypothetical protein
MDTPSAYAKYVVPLAAAFVLWIFAPAWALLALVGFVMWFLLAHIDGRAGVIVWLVCSGLAGFVVWFAYVWHASDEGAVPTCGSDTGFLFGPSWSGGGQASYGSNVTAFLIGLVLWLAGGVISWRFTRRSALVLAGFLVLYVAALAGLWYVAPHVWGPRRC